MSEHRCYLSTIGVFGAVACIAETLRLRLQPWPAWRLVVPAIMVVSVIALMTRTFDRHEAWRTNLALWSDTAKKSPSKSRVWANLGTALGTEQMNSRAAEAYSQSIALDPRNVQSHYNLAQIELRLQRFQHALEIADAGLRIDPKAYQFHQVRAVALMQLGQRDGAVRALEDSIALRPDDVWSHLALAEVLIVTGDHVRARQVCAAARTLITDRDENDAWLSRIEGAIRPATDSP